MFTVNDEDFDKHIEKLKISKHFMFTVNACLHLQMLKSVRFQNISCLRLMYRCTFDIVFEYNFKTFHVYG